jgi:DNA repair protein RadC
MQISCREQLNVIFRTASGEDIAKSDFEGELDTVKVPLRDIARKALSLDARSVLIRHNHPSGDVTPSRMDVMVTREIVAALRLIGVAVDDHHIVAGNQQFSFRDAGLI